MPVSQENNPLAINTPLGDDVVTIVRGTITEQLGRLFSMELELSSANPALDFSAVVGGNVTIRLELDKNETRYWNGYVSRFVQTEADTKAGGRYRATLVPWLWFLTRSADCRIFQNMTVPDIIKKVFRDQGFTDFKDSLSGPYGPWENCVQYRETDFNFVSRLMEHEGIYYYFTHENGKHTLVLADGISAHANYKNYDTVNFRAGRGGVTANEVIASWTLEQEVQPGAYSLNDFNFETPATSLLAKSQIATQNAQSAFEVYDYPGEFGVQSDGTEYARIRIEELHSQHEVVHGAGNVRGTAAGYTFTLASSPRPDQNRAYLVTSASHQLSGYSYGSGGNEGELYACSFTAIDSTKPFRAARITPKPLIQGPQTAMVVGPKGEEIHTDKYGRVIVQFHWDRYGKADENSSCWVRVSQHGWAGKGWGSFHLPRVGQEVIVEFLEGDPDLPLVTGNVYNAVTTPAVQLPDNKTASGWKSNSSKGGNGCNSFEFQDKKGEEQIYMHAEKDFDLYVKHDRQEQVANDRHLHVVANKYENVDASRHEKVGGSHFEQIGTDHNFTVTGKQAIQIGDSQSIKIKGKMIHEVTDDASEVFSANLLTSATGDIVIKSSASITIKVGGNSIAIGQDGIAIKGSMIKIEAEGPADFKGAVVNVEGQGQAALKAPMVSIAGDGITQIQGGMVMIN